MLKLGPPVADHPRVEDHRATSYQGDRDERRAPEPLLYTADQLLGRAPIRLRRVADKRRLAMHLLLAALLVALTAWWVLIPHVFAGPTLLVLGAGHGVHVGDLPSLLFLAVAGRSLLVARGVALARI